ncbi:anti-sigma regulatory factor (Ser/Thr protein kinase) [Streptomyces sp. LBL]|uniref:ATP-binding protein n=1 Tax=Streptomyces sp. LBL TaxID=2940562 RepID=UPI002476369E|nr:ATP-binding protein [Streptomyces sp. LBL]MDH6627878.1 anti-sigma regulatory factor (Ser/Thr protein kinase) [Streptomyces sp. LBL]
MTAPQAQPGVTVRMFFQQLSATRRGARLARHLATYQLDVWGIPFGSDVSDNVALVVAELASNAVLHARVPGRDFALRLEHRTDALRIEVADARGDRHVAAQLPAAGATDPTTDHGRGLVIVDVLASRWGVNDRPGPGKVVWADIDIP